MTGPEIPALRLVPDILVASVEGRLDLLLRGTVAHGGDLDALTVSHEGAVCNRVGFGRCREPDFSVVVSRPAAGLGDALTLDFALGTHSGAVVRETVELRLTGDGGRVSAALTSGTARADGAGGADAPVVQVETARLEAGRLILRGYVAGRAPVVVVGAFAGHAHLGNARLGRCREDILGAFPGHATHTQFLGNFAAGAAPFPASVRVQVIFEDGDSQETEVPAYATAMPPGAPGALDAGSDEIRLHCDEATLGEDGGLSVTGWCVARAGVRAVRVTLDGVTLGEAAHGGARPDVFAAHPEMTGAQTSGFVFTGATRGAPPAEATLTLVAEDQSGRATLLHVPVQRMAAMRADDLLKLNLDAPEVDGGVAVHPVTGHLTVEGWVLARSAVRSVEVLLDDERLGDAYFGLARPDVAQAFPEHARALRSGFTFHCPPRAMRNGAHDVALVFRLDSGLSHIERFGIVVQKPDGADEGGRIRERMTLAERQHRGRVRAALGATPPVCVHVRGAMVDATSRSLRAQCVDWHFWDGARRADALHVVLDGGDRLGADALDEFCRAAMRSDAELFYPDESAMFAGERGAFLKPRFSPELLLATNYVGTGFAVRDAALRRAAIEPGALADMAPYEVVLRVAEHARVQHLPLLLVERTAAAPALPWEEAALVQAALARRGIGGRVVAGRLPGTWRAMPAGAFAERVSIVIPTCGAADHIVTCLRTLRTTSHRNVEIVVIDNIPEDRPALRAHVAAHADRVVRMDPPFNWSAFNNAAAAAATGDMLLFLNDDVEITDPFWLDAMLELAVRPGVGAVGPQLLYPDGRVQHAGMFLADGIGRHAFRFAGGDDPRYRGLALTQRNVIAVTGACMLVARETFRRLGGFEEAHDVINNDLDFCLRLHEAGLRCVYTPAASLIHHELASRAGRAETYDTAAFEARWANVFAGGDPYFHPSFAGGCDDMRPEEEPVVEVYGGHPLYARADIRRIVAIKVDHIGDFVTALPVLRRLKRGFPEAALTVVGAPGVRGLAALEPAIDAFVPHQFFHAKSALGRAATDAAALDALEVLLRAEAFDLAIDLRKHPDTRPLLRRTGARILAGYDYQGQFPWLDVALEWEGDRGLHPKRFHVTDDLTHLVDAVIAAADEDRAGFAPLPAAAPLPAKVEALFARPVVCVHAGAGNPLKEWPAASFVALCVRLLRETDVALLFVGGPDEAAATDGILRAVRAQSGVRARAASVAGAVPLHELPGLMARCACYVGNDSGPKHMAAASGVPVVGIHSGSVDPLEWAPLGPDAVAVVRAVTCSPCYIADATRCPRRIACMTGIAPARVFGAVLRMLTLDRGRRGAIPARRSRSSAG